MKIFLAFIICVFFVACQNKNHNPQVTIITDLGNIELELYKNQAPKTVAAFIANVDAGMYKNTTFYRVLKNEDLDIQSNYGIIQGGIWPIKKKIVGIVHESTNQTGLSHTSGTISFARANGELATSEFFICIGEQTLFNEGNASPDDKKGFAAFGKVMSGMDVVRKIQDQKNNGDMFTKPIKIKDVERN